MAKVYFNLVKLIATDSLFPGTTVCGNERDINRHVETQAPRDGHTSKSGLTWKQ